jgi:hypothetical protein
VSVVLLEKLAGSAVKSPPSVAAFVDKWRPGGKAYKLGERAGAQAHFIELCAILDVPTPDDPDNYCFEKGFRGVASGHGFADVWKRDHFGWEYKAPKGNLGAALQQLIQYALPLENPPLLVVSDRVTFEIHTHFTGHPSEKTVLSLEDLKDPAVRGLLRTVFTDPYRFRPGKTVQQLTEDVASTFALIADRMRARGVEPRRAAHFLTQCVFCFFADDAGLLPADVFKRLIQKKVTPKGLQRSLTELFEKMQAGGSFGADDIPWFNGGLFKEIDIPDLKEEDVLILAKAASENWRFIDAAIFGTLFERGLDPSKRAQLGAHYTDSGTILRLLEPAIKRPLLLEWQHTRDRVATLLSKRDYLRVRAKGISSKSPELRERFGRLRSQANEAEREAKALHSSFLHRLSAFRVLDPACGSGNFLYMALKCLKDIEHLANFQAEELGLERQLSVTGPHNLLGIETNEFASELAKVTVWIGELQWLREHGYLVHDTPILQPLDHIETRDALIDPEGGEVTWPKADVAVGNPPFLGDKKMRAELGPAYVGKLRAAFAGRISGATDLVGYWFEKARAGIEEGRHDCAALVATNSLRGGRNRDVLDRICKTTRIFEAWSDEPWTNEGAAVHVSLIAFGNSSQQAILDGNPVDTIAADLTAVHIGRGAADLTKATSIPENADSSFSGIQKTGPFEVEGNIARKWLAMPNPNGRPNSDVVRPWFNGLDVVRRSRDMWIVDFGTAMPLETAALYEEPFKYLRIHVKPTRVGKREARTNENYWIFQWARPQMRAAIKGLPRFIVTPEVAKHRVFEWIPAGVVPDKNLVVVARSDDATFGVLHSRFHRLWALRLGTSLEDRPRYTPTTCFETFPFPLGLDPRSTASKTTEEWKGALIPAGLPKSVKVKVGAVAVAAKQLCDLRARWLNPSEWTLRVPEVIPVGLRTSPFPGRAIARDSLSAAESKALEGRTLTNLYNEAPDWLVAAHDTLDKAVSALYGWDYASLRSDEDVLRLLLAENQDRQVK